MKVCILSFFGDLLLRDTGPTVRIYQLAKGLASFNNEVHVIIPARNAIYKHVDGVTVHCVNGIYPQGILKI